MNTDIESYTANTNLLSIVTVTLNDLASLKTTIKNIGSQEFRQFEYIIIDEPIIVGNNHTIHAGLNEILLTKKAVVAAI